MARYLVTGGAGFIGSHLVETLLKLGEQVTVLDNFSTGKEENLSFVSELSSSSGDFTLLKGDIRDLSSCHEASKGVDFVLHQAALGSVPRSIDDPITTNEVNIQGTLNMLVAARDARVKRFVYASSSSVYGDVPSAGINETEVRPKIESQIPNPQSPYAVSKLTGEYYCRVFYKVYQLETIALRYFNVFGQRQDANSHYAAVIPKFISALLDANAPTIYGDGEQSRDFTFVNNVVQANLNGCASSPEASGSMYNIACGERTTLNTLYEVLCQIMDTKQEPHYVSPRPGDVRHSLADISKAAEMLKYSPSVTTSAGLKETSKWFADNYSLNTI
jgi:nucleoside-diphosphate-sugar epimerase